MADLTPWPTISQGEDSQKDTLTAMILTRHLKAMQTNEKSGHQTT
jgi:hypothetical protein